MPTYIALFMSTDGIPLQVGLFTSDEFLARLEAAKEKTKWALLINTATGRIASVYTKPEEDKVSKNTA